MHCQAEDMSSSPRKPISVLGKMLLSQNMQSVIGSGDFILTQCNLPL
jgi:hypothetical protein